MFDNQRRNLSKGECELLVSPLLFTYVPFKLTTNNSTTLSEVTQRRIIRVLQEGFDTRDELGDDWDEVGVNVARLEN